MTDVTAIMPELFFDSPRQTFSHNGETKKCSFLPLELNLEIFRMVDRFCP